MTARETQFSPRSARRKPDRAAPAEIAARGAGLFRGDEKDPAGSWTQDDLAALFAARASGEKVGASVERVATLADLPAAVARYVAANDLAPDFSLQPDPRLEELAWGGLRPGAPLRRDSALAVGIALVRRRRDRLAGLSFQRRGADAVSNFSPFITSSRSTRKSLLPRLEDYAALVSGLAVPRNVNLVTGASGTTDIEGVLARGAHGPGRLHMCYIRLKAHIISAALAAVKGVRDGQNPISTPKRANGLKP